VGNVLEVHPLLLTAIREREQQQATGSATGTGTAGDDFGASSFLALLNVAHFAVDHVLIKGRIISVVYDKVGGKYYGGRFKAGLTVLVDGKEAAYISTASCLVVNL
jgi:hypothetical protein